MALTFGFYNSINEDRRYDAIQMSSIFDGIIRDGIFMHVGTSMMVRASSGMIVTIGLGRAWFDHTWTLNDALYPVTIDQSEVVQDRIDTIVLEVNATLPIRANSYKVIKGTPSISPVRPTLIKSPLVNQYPLCDIRVNRGVTVINQANITNRVGTSDCPFVTGPLELMNIDALVAQWGDEWRHFYGAQTAYITNTTAELLAAWHAFYAEQTSEITGANELWRAQWESWFNSETGTATAEMAFWRNDREATFNAWFAALQSMLDGNVEANMAAAILELQNRTSLLEAFKDTLSNEFAVVHNVDDAAGNAIVDELGRPLEGRIIFCIKPCRAETQMFPVKDDRSRRILDNFSNPIQGRVYQAI